MSQQHGAEELRGPSTFELLALPSSQVRTGRNVKLYFIDEDVQKESGLAKVTRLCQSWQAGPWQPTTLPFTEALSPFRQWCPQGQDIVMMHDFCCGCCRTELRVSVLKDHRRRINCVSLGHASETPWSWLHVQFSVLVEG